MLCLRYSGDFTEYFTNVGPFESTEWSVSTPAVRVGLSPATSRSSSGAHSTGSPLALFGNGNPNGGYRGLCSRIICDLRAVWAVGTDLCDSERT